jgi:hypothetical protein
MWRASCAWFRTAGWRGLPDEARVATLLDEALAQRMKTTEPTTTDGATDTLIAAGMTWRTGFGLCHA